MYTTQDLDQLMWPLVGREREPPAAIRRSTSCDIEQRDVPWASAAATVASSGAGELLG
jgi:hypothetical protein